MLVTDMMRSRRARFRPAHHLSPALLLLLLLLSALWRPVTAQDSGLIARPIFTRACPASDSAIGTHGERMRGRISGSYRTDLGRTSAGLYRGLPRSEMPGVRSVAARMQFTGPPPTAAPGMVLQLDVGRRTPLPEDQRGVVLELDGGRTIGLGKAELSPYHPLAPNDLRTYLAPLSPEQFRQVAAAGSLRGRIGSDTFNVAPELLEDLRALYVAGVCGWRYNH